MLDDLSNDAFINALRCFIGLRGAVSQLRCDQGTKFVGASNDFKDALKQCDIRALEAFLADKQCEFRFNAPSASHAGGFWERQICTIRGVLDVTVAQCPGRLDDALLRTLFYEAMFIVNSRPLNIDGINDPRSLESLTPNHLILMKSSSTSWKLCKRRLVCCKKMASGTVFNRTVLEQMEKGISPEPLFETEMACSSAQFEGE